MVLRAYGILRRFFVCSFIVCTTPIYILADCFDLLSSAEQQINARRALPDLSWSPTDWQRMQFAYQNLPQTRAMTYVTTDPLKTRDMERLSDFGLSVEQSGNQYRIPYDQLNLETFVKQLRQSSVPFAPAFEIFDPAKQRSHYVRLGVDPLPTGPFEIISLGPVSHRDWGRLLGRGIYPMDPDLMYHELGHFLTYADDANYAQSVRSIYASGEGMPLENRLKRYEETGFIRFRSRPEVMQEFVKSAAGGAMNDLSDYLSSFASHLQIYGATSRQMSDLSLTGYFDSLFPELFASSLESRESVAILRQMVGEYDLYETYHAIHFLSDFVENPGVISRLSNFGVMDADAEAKIRELLSTPESQRREKVKIALSLLTERLDQLSREEANYAQSMPRLVWGSESARDPR